MAQLPPDSHCAMESHTLPPATAGAAAVEVAGRAVVVAGALVAGAGFLVPRAMTAGFAFFTTFSSVIFADSTTPLTVTVRWMILDSPCSPFSRSFSVPSSRVASSTYSAGASTATVSGRSTVLTRSSTISMPATTGSDRATLSRSSESNVVPRADSSSPTVFAAAEM